MGRAVVLSGLVAITTVFVAAGRQQTQQPEPTRLRVQTLDVSDNLYLITGGGGNTLALVTDGGVVLVDTKLSGSGPPLLEVVNAVTDRPVTTIINTHAHADHTGSNGEFRTAREIVAHENAQEHMRGMDAFSGPNATSLPTETFADTMSLLDGIDGIELYYFGAGHTNGDAVVVFPAKGVAYLGDLFPSKAAPVIDTSNGGSGVAFPETLTRVVAEIEGIDKVVRGHDVHHPGSSIRGWLTWDDLQDYADFNREFLEAVQDAFRAGKSVDEAVAELKLPERYTDYDMRQAPANVRAIYAELGR